MKKEDRYEKRGVSSQKEEVHQAIRLLDKGLFPDAFCKMLPDISGDPEYAFVMHADGAGTKSALAYIWWKITGDLSVWKGIAQDALVMNVDDLICVGATGPFIFSSSIGRNKKNIPGEILGALVDGTREFIENLTEWGIPSTLSGGETADVGDLVRTVIVDSTVSCRIKRSRVIGTGNIRPGMCIVGLCSYGKTVFEKEYNSGMGSNGLTAARHDLLHKTVARQFPESYDPSIETWAYTGAYLPEHPVKVNYKNPGGQLMEEEIPLAKLLLSPTRVYAPVLKDFIDKHADKIGAIIHCTGGGQTKILHFIKGNVRIIKDRLFEPGPLFNLLADIYGRNNPELFRNFNMGHRMELYVEPDIAEELIAWCARFNLEARIIGSIEKNDVPELVIRWGNHTFTYSPS